ncbi:hypothetical protein ACH4GM_00405 [Streptomyces coeruleorubidus]|uniref:hypothetical protein n=1 Tax=Streptomyces coeruleorubidus TaxID=116188 RepID=UPI0037A8B89E
MPSLAIVGAGPQLDLAIARDVLEYSPAGSLDSAPPTTPTATRPSSVESETNLRLYGAVPATQAVLPAMRQAGAGTLLYTSGAGSVRPVPRAAHAGAAAAALRNWAVNLHKVLADSGIQAAHITLDVTIGMSSFYGRPTATADQISPLYWDLHTTHRDEAERIFRG